MTHHFDKITEQIIEDVEAGAGDYSMPWHRLGTDIGQPFNAVTGHTYRGLNVLGLGLSAAASGYPTGRWASFRQWQSVGAQVRKGEKGTVIVFWQSRVPNCEDEDATEDKMLRGFIAKTFMVFNEAQVDDAPPVSSTRSDHGVEAPRALERLERLDTVILHGGDRAYFDPSNDLVRLPEPSQFVDQASYLSVRSHETVHWTGGKDRLNRDLSGRFGTASYAIEELVAELGAAFLCCSLGVSQVPRADHAAYISSWLKVLRQDNKAILTAASKAQEAVDYILSETAVNGQPSRQQSAIPVRVDQFQLTS